MTALLHWFRPRQVATYALTAGMAAVTDVGGFLALLRLGWWIEPAAALSFLLATVVNYLLSARFVFRHPPSARHYLRFLSVATLGFAVNTGITVGAIRLLETPSWLAKVAAIAIAFFVNYTLAVRFVFGADKKG